MFVTCCNGYVYANGDDGPSLALTTGMTPFITNDPKRHSAMRKRYDLQGTPAMLLVVSNDDHDNRHIDIEAGGSWPDFGESERMKRKRSASKNDLVISSFDKQRLTRLLLSAETSSEDREELADLTREIERGSEVTPQEMPPDVVTMNSRVRLTDLDAGSTHAYTIVFPADADYEKGRISILAPLGTALLGFRVGDVVDWRMPRGIRRLRIDEIIYQPETAGDFHL